jgi:hypothetical protein
LTHHDGYGGLNAHGKVRTLSAQIHTHNVAQPGGRVSVAKYFSTVPKLREKVATIRIARTVRTLSDNSETRRTEFWAEPSM